MGLLTGNQSSMVSKESCIGETTATIVNHEGTREWLRESQEAHIWIPH